MEDNVDVEISIDIGAIINALEEDPRFAAMIQHVLLKEARRMGDVFGKYAQKPTPTTVTPPPSGTQRVW